MWILIIIVVTVIIIWAITGNNSDNEKIRNYNLNSGGLRSKFRTFSNVMEFKYNYDLKFDDGRNLCYQKEVTNDDFQIGIVNIGIKLDFSNRPILYSKFINSQKTLNGLEIINFISDAHLIEDSIARTLKSINLRNNNEKNMMNNFNENMPEFWMEKAVESFMSSDLKKAKAFAKQAYRMDDSNIDYAFFYILSLLNKNKTLSIFELKNNINEIDIVMKDLRQKRINGLMNEQQENKFVELSDESYKYFEFVQNLEMRLDNGF